VSSVRKALTEVEERGKGGSKKGSNYHGEEVPEKVMRRV